MIIRITALNGEQYPLADIENFYVEHAEDGCDKLHFELDVSHPSYSKISEECDVEANGNLWLVKKIDDESIDCELNFDFLKSQYFRNYKSETRLCSAVMADILPSGWTIINGSVSAIKRSIKFDFCTGYDIMLQCIETYGVNFVWNIIGKTVTFYDPDAIAVSGEYVTSELNLKELSFKGTSEDFATRLYAYGKDDLTMETATVDGAPYGLPYVENLTYCNKVIVAYWSDDRYTDADSLYEAANIKLASICIPDRSYECSVVDLAKQSADYSFLTFSMFKKITLIDIERNLRVVHQVVKYREYPNEPERNVVTLSRSADTITAALKSKLGTDDAHIESVAEKVSGEVAGAVKDQLMVATALLTGAFGGFVYVQDDAIYLMDNADPAIAQRVWVWNVNGFGLSNTGIDGPYTTAITFDNTFITDVINAMTIRADFIEADSITAKQISQVYTTDTLNQALKAAEGMFTSKITAYDTSAQVTSKINQSANSILLQIAQKYPAKDNTVSKVAVYYALSDSATAYTGTDDDWSTTAPAWTSGKYMWQKTETTYADGTVNTSDLTCIQGANGIGIDTVTNYYLANSMPSGITKDNKGQYTWTTDVSSITLSATSKYLWSYEKTTYSDGTYKETDPCVIGMYGEGTDGSNTAIVYLYKRSSTSVSIDWTGPLTYSFPGKALTSVPSGWYQSIPAGTEPLFVTAATAYSKNDTDTIQVSEWSAPAILAQNGADGTSVTILGSYNSYTELKADHPTGNKGDSYLINGILYVWSVDDNDWVDVGSIQGPAGTDGLNTATVFLYQRAASAPSVPSSTLTYTFASGSISGSLGNWSKTIPAANGNPCYAIQATAISTSRTDTIASSEWSSPVVYVEDGSDGTSAFTAILSNESVTVPGTNTSAKATSINTNVYGFFGTTQCEITIGTISYSAAGVTLNSTTLDGLTRMLSFAVTTSLKSACIVTIPITITNREGVAVTVSKTLSVAVALSGEDGTGTDATAYWMLLSSDIVKLESGSYSPSAITMNGYRQTGNNAVTAHAGRFKVYRNNSTTAAYISSANESATTYTIPSGTTAIKIEFYAPGGTTTLLDVQSVGIVADGGDGVGIKSITEYYAVSSSSSTAPTSWSKTVPTMSAELPYLWNYEVVTMDDNTTHSSEKRVIGAFGTSGTGIENVKSQYYISNSKDECTGGSWSDTAPGSSSVGANQFVWIRDKIEYDDGAEAYTSPWCVENIMANYSTRQEVQSSIEQTADGILASVQETYVTESAMGEYREFVSSTYLEMDSDSFQATIESVRNDVADVDGDLQTTKSTYEKYMRFTAAGMEIGNSDNPLTLVLDNKNISFFNNGVQVAYWDAETGYFYTGNIKVEASERAQFGNYAFVPRTDGSLMFLKVGDD